MNETSETQYRSELTRRETLIAVGYLPFHVAVLPWLIGRFVQNVTMTDVNLYVYGFGMAFMLLAEGRFLRRDFDPLCDRFLLCLKTILGSYLWMMLSNYGVNDLILFLRQLLTEGVASASPNSAQIFALLLMTLPMTYGVVKQELKKFKTKNRKLSVLMDILCLSVIFFALEMAVTDIYLRSSVGNAATDNPNNSAIITMADSSMGIIAGMSVFMAPVVEEIIFRAGIFGTLRKKNRVLAYVVTILLFSVYHVYSYIAADPVNWIYILQYITVSFLLCRCYERTESIWSSIFLHMMINGISMWIISAMGGLL